MHAFNRNIIKYGGLGLAFAGISIGIKARTPVIISQPPIDNNFPLHIVNEISKVPKTVHSQVMDLEQIIVENENSPDAEKKYIENFAICYCWPSLVNGASGDIDVAVGYLRNFKYVIFGADLELDTHEDHYNTLEIIKRLTDTKVFGYINLGDSLSGKQHSPYEVAFRVIKWRMMGVYGIFFDECEPGFNVYRRLLRFAVNQCDIPLEGYNDSVVAFVNSNRYDLIMDWGVMRPGDIVLLESFMYYNGSSFNEEGKPYLSINPYGQWAIDNGITVAAEASYNTDMDPNEIVELHQIVEAVALQQKISLLAITDPNYAGSGAHANQIYVPGIYIPQGSAEFVQ